jgi:hypothetical protein
MEFDEQFGMVERGTFGVRASAQGDDVDAEVAALDRIHARPLYDLLDAKWRRNEVTLWGSTAQQMRAATMRRAAPAHPNDPAIARAVARRALRTRYRVEGDTLHIVQAVTLPVRAQTVTVNVTIGGE